MNRSRLSKKQTYKSVKNLFWSVIGIMAIIFILVKFGIPLLVNFSLFLSGTQADQKSQSKDNNSFVPIPILSSQNVATNSAQTKIQGSASPQHSIILYLNGNLADKVSTDANGNFSSTITLSPNTNIIKAKAVASDGKESEFSEGLTIIFKNTSPTLDISAPSDNQSFSKDQNHAEVKGKTDSQVRVTINDFWAIIDEDNNFLYNLPLKEGVNEIKIVATDQAGNKTEKNLKVTYSP